ncbi:MAG: hypothetical protein IJQ26_02750, partial [Lachnospiraceae bacterium]|nr:hypothetical protein [Lachnospiraceae bacterium]
LSVAGNAPLALKGEYTYIAPVNTITQTHVQTVGADTFLNTFYYDPAAASVYRINAAGEAELCLERVSADYMLAEDAKTFLYISDGSLYRADLTAAEAMPEKVVEEEVLYFTASKNASMIAYIDGEERLMLKKGNDAPVCLLEQAKDTRAYQEGNNPWYGCVTYLPDADSFYYLDEGAVCLTNDGVDIAKKDDFTGDAIYLFGMPGYLTVYTDENGSIHQYFTLDGVNFHTFS